MHPCASICVDTRAGTYNNMWIVLDLANFKAGKALPPGFLMIIEEIPTMTRSYDATPILGFGAFTSYNIPCDKSIKHHKWPMSQTSV